jgi:spore maturation protein CgeB
LEILYSEDELVYFDSLPDLIDKIRYYAQHTNRIAEKGWHRAHHSLSCERVTKFMVELVFASPFSEQYEWAKEIYHH